MPDALSIAIVVTIINLGIVVFDIAQRAKIGKLIDDKRPTYSDWPDPSPQRVISRKDDEYYHKDDMEFANSNPLNFCPFCGRSLKGENDV